MLVYDRRNAYIFRKNSNPLILCIYVRRLFFFFLFFSIPSVVFLVLDLHPGPTVLCIAFFACLLPVQYSYVCDYIDLMVSNHQITLVHFEFSESVAFFFSFACIFLSLLSTEKRIVCMLRIYVVFLCVFFYCLIFCHTWEMLSFY